MMCGWETRSSPLCMGPEGVVILGGHRVVWVWVKVGCGCLMNESDLAWMKLHCSMSVHCGSVVSPRKSLHAGFTSRIYKVSRAKIDRDRHYHTTRLLGYFTTPAAENHLGRSPSFAHHVQLHHPLAETPCLTIRGGWVYPCPSIIHTAPPKYWSVPSKGTAPGIQEACVGCIVGITCVPICV